MRGGGYLNKDTKAISDVSSKARVYTVVDAAIATDMYGIVDWHSHHAEDYKIQAITFFIETASSTLVKDATLNWPAITAGGSSSSCSSAASSAASSSPLSSSPILTSSEASSSSSIASSASSVVRVSSATSSITPATPPNSENLAEEVFSSAFYCLKI